MKQISTAVILFLSVFGVVLPVSAKKNILLITIDTLRYDRISTYTDRFVKTENIDRLAEKSVVFTRAFAHTPLTLPSHANILTGTTPLFHGISDNNRFRLDDRFLTLAEHLKAHGYTTAAFTASFVLNEYFGLNQGFDLYKGPDKSNELTAEEIIGPSVDWLKQNGGPWFLWIHIWDPHAPYSPPEPFKSIFKKDLYSGEVAYVDHQLGTLFRFLEQKGFMDRTAIILTGDHGEALGDHGELEHGYFAYNESIHIPLIIYDMSFSPDRISRNVSHIDIFPTVCDLLGTGIPDHVQGRSLIPLIKGGDFDEETIYFEAKLAYYSRGWAPLDGFIRKERKFINLPIKELYDLNKDFGENRNIISSVRITDLYATLDQLKSSLTGSDRDLSKKKIEPRALKKLKSFGYLTGIVQEKKTVFSREDDLKVMLPIQLEFNEARKLEKEGKYAEAIVIYRNITKLRPDNISTYLHMGELYHETGRIQAGLDVVEEGLKIIPANPELLLRKGILLVEIHRFSEGRAILENILKNDPDNGEAWNYLGISFYRNGENGKALDAYRRSEAADNSNPTLFNNIGTLYLSMYLKQKDTALHKNAVANFNKALELDKRLPSALNGMGAAHKFIGQKDKAVEYWKMAVRSKPDFIEVYFNLAITLIESGKKEEAKSYLDTLRNEYYSRLDPRSREQLERLLSGIK